MSNVVNDVLDLLRGNPDVVVLALSIVVLTEAAIIVLWARRTVRLQRALDLATATAQAAEAAAAKAQAASNAFRIGDVDGAPSGMGLTVQDGDRTVYSLRAKQEQQAAAAQAPALAADTPETPATPPAAFPASPARPPLSPATPAAFEPAPLPPASASPDATGPAAPPEDFVNPVAERAAAWVLPEVEASRSTPPAPADAVDRPQPASAAPPIPPGEPTPTVFDWAAPESPVQPADDFAVVTETEAVSRWAGNPAPPAAAHNTPPRNPWDTAAEPSDATAQAFPSAATGAEWSAQDIFATTPQTPDGWGADSEGDQADPDAEAILQAQRHSGADILLVEDDPGVARLYSILLQSRGYTVRHASDGLEGFDAVHVRRPDLVLLDIMMPRMNGIAFLQALRTTEFRDVPVVVLSNFMEKQLVSDALSLGAIEYMIKAQTRPEALVGALPHWLRGERAFSY